MNDPIESNSPDGAVVLPRIVRLAAEASMRASQAEDVARSCYYTDPEMSRYAVAEMRKDRAESRRLFALANTEVSHGDRERQTDAHSTHNQP